MNNHRVFFSLTTVLMILWVPYNYAFVIIFSHAALLILLGATATIPLLTSAIILLIIGIIRTRKDHRWFDLIISTLRFYKSSPSSIFKRRVKYVS